MKTPVRNLLLAGLVSCLTLTFAVVAQDAPKPTPPPPDQPADVTTPAEPAEATTVAAPEKTELRRLDVPDAEATPSNDDVEAPAKPSEPAATEAAPVPAAPAVESAAEPPTPPNPANHRPTRHRGSGSGRVAIFRDASLSAGEEAEAVVSIFGSSTSAGSSEAVVSVGGSSTSSGDVANAVVSVLGGSRVLGGTVGDTVVSILGNTYVNAPVRGEVVTVLGNVELGPEADVRGELICIGGQVTRDPKAVLHGQVTNVTIGPFFTNFDWLHAWVTKCLLLGRPLAFGAHLMWAWWLALGFLALYVLLAALFPRGVEKCTVTLEERPGKSILTAFLVTLITPAAAILLAITVIGTPALIISLFVAGIFGKVVMLAWIGRRFTRLAGEDKFTQPVVAVLVGGVVVLLLYTIPIVGFVVSKLIAWLGLGAVVYTVILGMRRSKPTAAAPAHGAVPPVVVAPTAPLAGTVPPQAPTSGEITSDVPLGAAAAANGAGLPLAVSAVSYPRAGFWIRIAASLIDAIVVGIAIAFFPHGWTPNFLLVYAVYCTVLWALKATTVGGIVCNLKVVRLDDRPLDWPTALVRVLAGFLSLVVAGLGFIWVAFDEQKQSWHDKIAGTTVVQVPRGVSLL